MSAERTDTDGAAALDPSTLEMGGFAGLIGLRLDAASPDEVAASWTVTEALLQPFGLLHGGVHCAVVETLGSIGGALWWGERGSAVGVHNGTDFFRSARVGDALTSVARPVHRGRSQQLWRIETHDEQGRLVSAGEVRIQNLPA